MENRIDRMRWVTVHEEKCEFLIKKCALCTHMTKHNTNIFIYQFDWNDVSKLRTFHDTNIRRKDGRTKILNDMAQLNGWLDESGGHFNWILFIIENEHATDWPVVLMMTRHWQSHHASHISCGILINLNGFFFLSASQKPYNSIPGFNQKMCYWCITRFLWMCPR